MGLDESTGVALPSSRKGEMADPAGALAPYELVTAKIWVV
jgi:hypothetical protein